MDEILPIYTAKEIRSEMRKCSGEKLLDSEVCAVIFIKDKRYNAYLGNVNKVAEFQAKHMNNSEYFFPRNICILRQEDKALDGWIKAVETGKVRPVKYDSTSL